MSRNVNTDQRTASVEIGFDHCTGKNIKRCMLLPRITEARTRGRYADFYESMTLEKSFAKLCCGRKRAMALVLVMRKWFK